jgi:hypothetical protein
MISMVAFCTCTEDSQSMSPQNQDGSSILFNAGQFYKNSCTLLPGNETAVETTVSAPPTSDGITVSIAVQDSVKDIN